LTAAEFACERGGYVGLFGFSRCDRGVVFWFWRIWHAINPAYDPVGVVSLSGRAVHAVALEQLAASEEQNSEDDQRETYQSTNYSDDRGDPFLGA
jgi:hypothetical protein